MNRRVCSGRAASPAASNDVGAARTRSGSSALRRGSDLAATAEKLRREPNSTKGGAMAQENVAMPEFFVPGAVSLQEAEKVWQATKKFAEEQTGWIVTNRRIFRLEYSTGAGTTSPRLGRRSREPANQSSSSLGRTPTSSALANTEWLAASPSWLADRGRSSTSTRSARLGLATAHSAWWPEPAAPQLP